MNLFEELLKIKIVNETLENLFGETGTLKVSGFTAQVNKLVDEHIKISRNQKLLNNKVKSSEIEIHEASFVKENLLKHGAWDELLIEALAKEKIIEINSVAFINSVHQSNLNKNKINSFFNANLETTQDYSLNQKIKILGGRTFNFIGIKREFLPLKLALDSSNFNDTRFFNPSFKKLPIVEKLACLNITNLQTSRFGNSDFENATVFSGDGNNKIPPINNITTFFDDFPEEQNDDISERENNGISNVNIFKTNDSIIKKVIENGPLLLSGVLMEEPDNCTIAEQELERSQQTPSFLNSPRVTTPRGNVPQDLLLSPESVNLRTGPIASSSSSSKIALSRPSSFEGITTPRSKFERLSQDKEFVSGFSGANAEAEFEPVQKLTNSLNKLNYEQTEEIRMIKEDDSIPDSEKKDQSFKNEESFQNKKTTDKENASAEEGSGIPPGGSSKKPPKTGGNSSGEEDRTEDEDFFSFEEDIKNLRDLLEKIIENPEAFSFEEQVIAKYLGGYIKTAGLLYVHPASYPFNDMPVDVQGYEYLVDYLNASLMYQQGYSFINPLPSIDFEASFGSLISIRYGELGKYIVELGDWANTEVISKITTLQKVIANRHYSASLQEPYFIGFSTLAVGLISLQYLRNIPSFIRNQIIEIFSEYQEDKAAQVYYSYYGDKYKNLLSEKALRILAKAQAHEFSKAKNTKSGYFLRHLGFAKYITKKNFESLPETEKTLICEISVEEGIARSLVEASNGEISEVEAAGYVSKMINTDKYQDKVLRVYKQVIDEENERLKKLSSEIGNQKQDTFLSKLRIKILVLQYDYLLEHKRTLVKQEYLWRKDRILEYLRSKDKVSFRVITDAVKTIV